MQIEHIHFYVEDATVWRDWFIKYLGFHAAGSLTTPQICCEIVTSGSIYLVLSSPLTPLSPVRQYLQHHPAGVVDIAFRVENLASVIAKAMNAGAKILQPAQEKSFSFGALKWSKIAGWGDLSHTFIENQEPQISGLFIYNQWVELSQQPSLISTHQYFTKIDHIVLNVAAGRLETAIDWYKNVFGFQPKQTFKIQTKRSGLHSQVLVHPDGNIQLPINEPSDANSQIQEFLEINHGSGIQHIALSTQNIVQTVQKLRQAGVAFIQVPATYYTQLKCRHRIQLSDQEWQEIQQAEILVDWQEENPDALLLQTFTQPIFGQPTFFFEIIERRFHAKGFGEGNFRALFEAIERQQIQRNLKK